MPDRHNTGKMKYVIATKIDGHVVYYSDIDKPWTRIFGEAKSFMSEDSARVHMFAFVQQNGNNASAYVDTIRL